MENSITKDKNVLVCGPLLPNLTELYRAEYDNLIENFCGKVMSLKEANAVLRSDLLRDKTIYLCGDLSELDLQLKDAYIIEELSSYYGLHTNLVCVKLGEVPIIINGVGVYFREYFCGDDLFKAIKNEHTFQELTDSNKPSKAFRKGIYLSRVEEKDGGDLRFNLLRCSSNLSGPTENFGTIDDYIIEKANRGQTQVFKIKTELNHVLAQIYENTAAPESFFVRLINAIWMFLFGVLYFKILDRKERKARISAHSDKTKDMPREGLIAFCTFYDGSYFHNQRANYPSNRSYLTRDSQPLNLTRSSSDLFDRCYKKTSVYTQLRFKLKSMVESSTLVKDFTVTLYPNSMFVIPLSTNRLYTHEIKPPSLNVDQIPTRLGYVIRCSNTFAICNDQGVHIEKDGELVGKGPHPTRAPSSQLVKLLPVDQNKLTELRASYLEENTTDKVIEYAPTYFSMNQGDYMRPLL